MSTKSLWAHFQESSHKHRSGWHQGNGVGQLICHLNSLGFSVPKRLEMKIRPPHGLMRLNKKFSAHPKLVRSLSLMANFLHLSLCDPFSHLVQIAWLKDWQIPSSMLIWSLLVTGIGPYVEVAFYHKRSRTLLVTDAVIFVPRQPPECISKESLLASAKNGLAVKLLSKGKDVPQEPVVDNKMNRQKGLKLLVDPYLMPKVAALVLNCLLYFWSHIGVIIIEALFHPCVVIFLSFTFALISITAVFFVTI